MLGVVVPGAFCAMSVLVLLIHDASVVFKSTGTSVTVLTNDTALTIPLDRTPATIAGAAALASAFDLAAHAATPRRTAATASAGTSPDDLCFLVWMVPSFIPLLLVAPLALRLVALNIRKHLRDWRTRRQAMQAATASVLLLAGISTAVMLAVSRNESPPVFTVSGDELPLCAAYYATPAHQLVTVSWMLLLGLGLLLTRTRHTRDALGLFRETRNCWVALSVAGVLHGGVLVALHFTPAPAMRYMAQLPLHMFLAAAMGWCSSTLLWPVLHSEEHLVHTARLRIVRDMQAIWSPAFHAVMTVRSTAKPVSDLPGWVVSVSRRVSRWAVRHRLRFFMQAATVEATLAFAQIPALHVFRAQHTQQLLAPFRWAGGLLTTMACCSRRSQPGSAIPEPPMLISCCISRRSWAARVAEAGLTQAMQDLQPAGSGKCHTSSDSCLTAVFDRHAPASAWAAPPALSAGVHLRLAASALRASKLAESNSPPACVTFHDLLSAWALASRSSGYSTFDGSGTGTADGLGRRYVLYEWLPILLGEAVAAPSAALDWFQQRGGTVVKRADGHRLLQTMSLSQSMYQPSAMLQRGRPDHIGFPMVSASRSSMNTADSSSHGMSAVISSSSGHAAPDLPAPPARLGSPVQFQLPLSSSNASNEPVPKLPSYSAVATVGPAAAAVPQSSERTPVSTFVSSPDAPPPAAQDPDLQPDITEPAVQIQPWHHVLIALWRANAVAGVMPSLHGWPISIPHPSTLESLATVLSTLGTCHFSTDMAANLVPVLAAIDPEALTYAAGWAALLRARSAAPLLCTARSIFIRAACICHILRDDTHLAAGYSVATPSNSPAFGQLSALSKLPWQVCALAWVSAMHPIHTWGKLSAEAMWSQAQKLCPASLGTIVDVQQLLAEHVSLAAASVAPALHDVYINNLRASVDAHRAGACCWRRTAPVVAWKQPSATPLVFLHTAPLLLQTVTLPANARCENPAYVLPDVGALALCLIHPATHALVRDAAQSCLCGELVAFITDVMRMKSAVMAATARVTRTVCSALRLRRLTSSQIHSAIHIALSAAFGARTLQDDRLFSGSAGHLWHMFGKPPEGAAAASIRELLQYADVYSVARSRHLLHGLRSQSEQWPSKSPSNHRGRLSHPTSVNEPMHRSPTMDSSRLSQYQQEAALPIPVLEVGPAAASARGASRCATEHGEANWANDSPRGFEQVLLGDALFSNQGLTCQALFGSQGATVSSVLLANHQVTPAAALSYAEESLARHSRDSLTTTSTDQSMCEPDLVGSFAHDAVHAMLNRASHAWTMGVQLQPMLGAENSPSNQHLATVAAHPTEQGHAWPHPLAVAQSAAAVLSSALSMGQAPLEPPPTIPTGQTRQETVSLMELTTSVSGSAPESRTSASRESSHHVASEHESTGQALELATTSVCMCARSHLLGLTVHAHDGSMLAELGQDLAVSSAEPNVVELQAAFQREVANIWRTYLSSASSSEINLSARQKSAMLSAMSMLCGEPLQEQGGCQTTARTQYHGLIPAIMHELLREDSDRDPMLTWCLAVGAVHAGAKFLVTMFDEPLAEVLRLLHLNIWRAWDKHPKFACVLSTFLAAHDGSG